MATFHIFMWAHQVKVDKVGPKRKCPIENVGSCTGYQMMGGGGHFLVWWLRSVYQEMAFQLNLQCCSPPRLIKSSLTTMNVYLLVSTKEKLERKIASLSHLGWQEDDVTEYKELTRIYHTHGSLCIPEENM